MQVRQQSHTRHCHSTQPGVSCRDRIVLQGAGGVDVEYEIVAGFDTSRMLSSGSFTADFAAAVRLQSRNPCELRWRAAV